MPRTFPDACVGPTPASKNVKGQGSSGAGGSGGSKSSKTGKGKCGAGGQHARVAGGQAAGTSAARQAAAPGAALEDDGLPLLESDDEGGEVEEDARAKADDNELTLEERQAEVERLMRLGLLEGFLAGDNGGWLLITDTHTFKCVVCIAMGKLACITKWTSAPGNPRIMLSAIHDHLVLLLTE
ncbi:hypothetical protein GPECTOR_28g767 [Gonium pectorale]|uniref:Uncharacterized protein n=1 Tax=Gonium pectorale TaxID=33097 RepID=A0A150GG95_GONPE|nr:hypothetical protein GPECTOR_28g767 [Gonium pectorale]|eukprot:KXZ48360.1 hypothetical protein GPECTOR_28g767 [Gonium pectorale]